MNSLQQSGPPHNLWTIQMLIQIQSYKMFGLQCFKQNHGFGRKSMLNVIMTGRSGNDKILTTGVVCFGHSTSGCRISWALCAIVCVSNFNLICIHGTCHTGETIIIMPRVTFCETNMWEYLGLNIKSIIFCKVVKLQNDITTGIVRLGSLSSCSGIIWTTCTSSSISNNQLVSISWTSSTL